MGRTNVRFRRSVVSIQGRRRRPGRGTDLGALAVLATTLAIVASACGSSRTASSSPGPGATPSFGPVPTTAPPPPSPLASNLPPGVLAEIPVSGGPLRMGVGFGSVWVATHRDTLLYRIDPSTNKVIARIDVGQEECGTPGIGFGRVWAIGCDPGTHGNLVVVDPSTNQVVGSLRYGGLVSGFGAGSVWVGPRIDPKTLRVQANVRASGAETAFADGAAWVADEEDGTVSRVDPATNKVVAIIPAGVAHAGESFVAVQSGRLWIYPGLLAPASGDARDNTIWAINPHDNTVKQETLRHLSAFDPLLGGATLAVGMGSLWIRLQGGAVRRFDARTLKPQGAYPADTTTGGFVTMAFGSIWESNLEANTVWRVRV
jgi:YVTN family beta-propeller protein